MRRLTILLAVLAAVMLVPAAQALAAGEMIVTIVGTGSGEVNSQEGNFSGIGLYQGTPPLECTYNGEEQSGTCENELEITAEEPEIEGVDMVAKPFGGSEFAGWTVETGFPLAGCEAGSVSSNGYPECLAGALAGSEEFVFVTVTFEECSGGCVPLTVEKTGTGTGGVVSDIPGIDCGAECSVEYDEGLSIFLTATADPESEFTGWTGCNTQVEGKCKVTMSEAKEVEATFEPEAAPYKITLIKEGGGEGWVTSQDAEHALNCGPPCEERMAEFEGPVILHAYGKQFKGWGPGDCDAEPSFRECEVSEEGTVHAEFVSKKALTLVKEGGGEGWVTSLDAEHLLNCGPSCTERTAYFESGPVELRAYGQQFQGWTEGCAEVLPPSERVCKVELATDEEVKAEFE